MKKKSKKDSKLKITSSKEIYYLLAAMTIIDMKNKYTDEYTEFELYLYGRYEEHKTNFEIYYDNSRKRYWFRHKPIKGVPMVITSWEDLAKLEPIGDISIKVDLEWGNGEILYKGKYMDYLSTHSLYESNYKETENLLRCYGFNVQILIN